MLIYPFQGYVMISAPLESVCFDVEHNIPLTFKCFTLFSHSTSSWSDINMNFDSINLTLKLDKKSYPYTSMNVLPFSIHSPNSFPNIKNINHLYYGNYYNIRYSQWKIERLGEGYDTDCR